jgi:AcrR family transcriptional regulator
VSGKDRQWPHRSQTAQPTPASPSRQDRRWSRLDHDERRGQILAAARELFARRPYGEVATVEIARAAGVTRGLLHHYFGTKRALYLEVVADLVGTPVAPLLQAIGGAGAGGRTVGGWPDSVDAWMDLIEGNRDAWFVAISAGETGQDRAMRDILEKARDDTATEVIRVLALDESQTPEVRSVVRAFSGLAEEVTREWLQRGRLSRAQARVLLVGSLPLLVEQLLPQLVAARGVRSPRRRLTDQSVPLRR